MTKKVIRLSSKERKKQIKECILEILFTEGMSKLSTRYLAQKVGVSEGALFRHYPTKKEMIQDIVNDVNDELIFKLKKISESKITADKRLVEYMCFTIKYLHKKKGITLLLFTEASYKNDEGLKETMDNIYHQQKQLFSKIILDGIAEDLWDKNININGLANLYMGIPVTLNIETILHKGKFDSKAYCEEMNAFIFKILQKN